MVHQLVTYSLGKGIHALNNQALLLKSQVLFIWQFLYCKNTITLFSFVVRSKIHKTFLIYDYFLVLFLKDLGFCA